jgi:hypothetical protein
MKELASQKAPEIVKRIILELAQESELWDKIEAHSYGECKLNVTFCFLGDTLARILVQDVF